MECYQGICMISKIGIQIKKIILDEVVSDMKTEQAFKEEKLGEGHFKWWGFLGSEITQGTLGEK